MMNYDPNLLLCGRTAEQAVRLTFADWEYRAEMTVTIYGNIRGLEIIIHAVERAFEELFDDERGYAKLVLTNQAGDTLTDAEGDDDEWLMQKLIKAEIVSITPSNAARDEGQERVES